MDKKFSMMLVTGQLPPVPDVDQQLFDELLVAPFELAFVLLDGAIMAIKNKKWTEAAVNASLSALICGRFMNTHPERAKRLSWIASFVAMHAGMRKNPFLVSKNRRARLKGFMGIAAGLGKLPGGHYSTQIVRPSLLFGLGHAAPTMLMRIGMATRELERAEAALLTRNAAGAAIAAQNALELAAQIKNPVVAADIQKKAMEIIGEAEFMEPRSMLLRSHLLTPPERED